MLYFFVESLELRTWLFSVWPAIREALKRQPNVSAKLFVVDSRPELLKFVQMITTSKRLQVERMDFNAAEIFDEDGVLIWLRIYYQDMKEALHSVVLEPEFDALLSDGKTSQSLKSYIKKQVLPGLPVYAGSGLWRGVYLAQVALWHSRKNEVSAQQTTLFLNRNPWTKSLGNYAWKYGGLNFVAIGRKTQLLNILRLIVGRDVRHLIGNIRQLFAPWPKVCHETSRPSLALQYYGHFNIDEPQLYSDFFFWQQSNFPADQLLALFSIAKDPLTERKHRAMSKHGIRSLALGHNTLASAGCVSHTKTRLVSNLTRAIKAVANTLSPLELGWLKSQQLVYQSRKEYWKDLFRAQNIKVYATWYKYDGDHCVIGDALRELGGALAVYQRSYEGNATAQTALLADVYFGFSSSGAQVEAEAGSEIGCYVTTGYLGDHRFPLVREEADNLRHKLQLNGAKRIVAFFDEGSLPDERWGIDAKRLQAHYAFLLEKLLGERDLGLIFKPKTPSYLYERLGRVGVLLQRAVQTGRCHVYQDGVLQGSVPPVMAALSADLVIHGSLSGCTAATEAALAGVPTVLLDDDGWSPSPLNKLGLGRVIFNNFEALWQTWAEFRSNASGLPGFADWSPVLHDIDPFRDGLAARRMGTFLKWMMEGFSDGLSRDAVIEQAAARYRQAWGSDKILEVRPAK
jgi:hypothetical protein